MIPLSQIRHVATWLSICSIDEKASKMEKLTRTLIAVAFFIIETLFIVSSIAFVAKYKSSDMIGCAFAYFFIFAAVGIVHLMCTAIYSRSKISAMLDHLKQIYETNEGGDLYTYLEHAGNLTDRLSQLYFRYMPPLTAFNVCLKSLISVVICAINSDFTEIEHPLYVILPWNTQTPLGFIIEIVLSIATSQFYIYANGIFLLIFISLCLHHRAFFRMFQHLVNKLDVLAGKENPTELLCDIVRFHNTAKTFFLESSEIYSPCIFNLLICNMMIQACALFLVDQQIGQLNVQFTFLAAIIAFGQFNLFIYCYIGKTATENYSNMGNCLYHSNWRRLPVHLQKYVLLMIQNMQRPLEYSAFGMTVLHLHTYTKLMNSLFSYYMMFKNFASK